MEMEEMDGRRMGGMSARSWKSAARQELAQSVAASSPTCLYRNSNQRCAGWLVRKGNRTLLQKHSKLVSLPSGWPLACR